MSRKARCTTIVLVPVLAGLAGAALVREARSVGAIGVGERLHLLTMDLEQRYRNSTREHYEVYRLLREHVPRASKLFIYSALTDVQQRDFLAAERLKKELQVLQAKLRALRFPAQVTMVGGAVAGVERYLALLDPSCYVINVTPAAEFPGQAWFEPVAQGRTASIFRFHGRR